MGPFLKISVIGNPYYNRIIFSSEIGCSVVHYDMPLVQGNSCGSTRKIHESRRMNINYHSRMAAESMGGTNTKTGNQFGQDVLYSGLIS